MPSGTQKALFYFSKVENKGQKGCKEKSCKTFTKKCALPLLIFFALIKHAFTNFMFKGVKELPGVLPRLHLSLLVTLQEVKLKQEIASNRAKVVVLMVSQVEGTKAETNLVAEMTLLVV